ncbi:DUF2249 domain-containing protein [Candidatus Sulfurimonas baltica]|uniref:DUF2249 domain-containing protein n=1 Tax=Candidatus Sulfurimonas baltica TaxID=2740404 RepID=A0A7S7LUC3_9BACT|nr:DUF2249 domain-containing protein [Candidatus Sulfurimonas baltica]QOY51018.1 DUF2249 domain-containing protein [Candidatus Sulfurimonas baltica]
MKKELIELRRATLDIYKYEKEGLTFYEFDATECEPPEPMVNTIVAISLLKTKEDRLVGIYFHEPYPLYERLPKNISHESKELPSGDFRVTFKID